MKKILFAGMLALGAMAVILGANQAALAPKYSTKEVMKKGFAGKEALCGKIAKGNATAEEKEQMLELLSSLCENKAPRGEQQAWVAKCEAMTKAVKDGDAKAFQAAANCKACHDAHKPAKK